MQLMGPPRLKNSQSGSKKNVNIEPETGAFDVRNIEALGVDRAKLIEFVCNKHSVGTLFDLKPNVLVGELKAIYLNKKGQAQNEGGKTKTW
jgi:hypothetical protein